MADATQAPAAIQIGFRRGDEYRRHLTMNIDLTGRLLVWQIHQLRGGPVVVEGTMTFTTPPHTVGLVIHEVETERLLPGTYGFRATWATVGGVTRTFLEGTCEVTR